MLKHVHHRVPVTALALIAGQNVILAGEGSILKSYDANSGSLLSSLPVFEDQPIHGIVVAPDGSSTVVWGGCAFVRLSISVTRDGVLSLSSGCVARASDWILNAAFGSQPSTEMEYEVAMITAHNALLFPSLDGTRIDHISSDPIDARSNCILYSAHIRWLSSSCLLIASGTAFGDVLLWSCFVDQNDAVRRLRKPQMHYTFSAHDGSVFGVQLSSRLQPLQGHGDSYLLATCSDDRTIKVWDVSDFRDQEPAPAQQQRDTGFGHKITLGEITPRCLAKTLGHVSRIWHVRFDEGADTIDGALIYEKASFTNVSIMSFGEDATCISWSMRASIDGALPFTLIQTSVDLAHAGKHIWSVATDITGQVSTGGADGTIALRSRRTPYRNALQLRTDETSDLDNLRVYAYVGDCLIATTDRGRIILISPKDCHHEKVMQEISSELPALRGYSIATSINKTAVIAGTDGTIYLYQQDEKRLLHYARSTGKVAGLFACQADLETVCLLVTSVSIRTATIYSWVERFQADLGIDDMMKDERRLEVPKDFVVTSFCMAQGKDGGYIAVLGSRGGALAVFNLGATTEKCSWSISLLIENVHRAETVTALHCQTEHRQGRRIIYLFSTGRDGTQAVHELHVTDECMILETTHQLPLSFGPNIEGLAMIDQTLLVWGFRGKHFVVCDATHQRHVMTVDCGGSHRQWAFRPQLHGGSFVWTKASKVYHISQTEPVYKLLNDGGHGREIKAVAVSPDDRQIIATGSEDTNIKLFTLSSTGFECQQTLRRHVTGIQVLKWSHDGTYLFSGGGYEEFFVWRIYKDCRPFKLGVVCESSHPNNGVSDLRIMDFDVTSTNTGYIITLGYSNSTLRQWSYSRTTGWMLLASGEYLTACLTYVQHLRTSDAVVSAATDGHLTVWRLSSTTLTWRHRQMVHQSSILSVAMNRISNESTLIVTGGDDNAIGLTLLSTSDCIQSSDRHPVIGTLLIPRAHAAAITGIVLQIVSSTQLLLTSSSIDQRIKTWQVDISPDMAGIESLAISQVQDVGTDVADVSCLAIVGQEVLIVGVGMDLH